MKIYLNGKEEEVKEVSTLSELVKSLNLDMRTMAVGRNGSVVRKTDLEKTKIESGDQIDLVRFVAGG